MCASLIIVLGISYGVKAKPVLTAQISQATSCVWSLTTIGYAWRYLFRKRPPLKVVPKGSSLLRSGWTQNIKTTKKLLTAHRGLKWFFISLLFTPEQGSGSLLTVLVTFMTVHLNMIAIEVGAVTLILLLSSTFGSLLSRVLCRKINPLKSFQCAILFMGAVIIITAASLVDPTKKVYMYVLVIPAGISFGWVYPSQRVILCTITPSGQEAEIMGIYTLFAQVLSWVPPLVFGAINEVGYGLNWALVSFASFFVLSFACTLFIGSYEEALNLVKEEEDVTASSEENQGC